MSNCMFCQSPINPSDKFCPDCGKAQQAEATTCPECEQPIKATDAFCRNCGQSAEEACPACGAGVAKNAATCGNCGFNIIEGTSLSYTEEDKQKAKEVLALLYEPIGLRELKQKYPYLTQGSMEPVYVRVIEQAMIMGKKEPIVNLQLASYPRQWALQKVGWLRRLLTLTIDMPAFLALFLGGLVLFIGSAKEAGMLPLEGAQRGAFAWAWFFCSYFAYFVSTERLFGATIGGLFCGLRVVDKFGNRQSFTALLKRNSYKLVPLLGPYVMSPFLETDHEIVKS
jgi:hypothetical protein